MSVIPLGACAAALPPSSSDANYWTQNLGCRVYDAGIPPAIYFAGSYVHDAMGSDVFNNWQNLKDIPAGPATGPYGTGEKYQPCPNGECKYQVIDGAVCGSDIGRMRYSAWYKQLQWDSAWKQPCCLGTVPEGRQTYVSLTPPNVNGDNSLVQARIDNEHMFCDPRWCPKDPSGACADVMEQACQGSATLADGTVVHKLLSGPDTVCGAWYLGALDATAPNWSARWPVIDRMVEKWCGVDPSRPSCGCFSYSPDSVCNDTNSCFMYTSVSQDTPAEGTIPPDADLTKRRIQLADGVTGVPVGLTDYACTVEACRDTRTQLQTWDVWHTRKQCPADICVQVIQDAYVTTKQIQAGGGIFIDNSTNSCAGSVPSSITAGAPRIDMTFSETVLLPDLAGTDITRPYAIGNIGSGPLEWTLSAVEPETLPPWLRIDTRDGTIQPGEEAIFGITFVNLPTAWRTGALQSQDYTFRFTLQDKHYSEVMHQLTVVARAYHIEEPNPPLPPEPTPWSNATLSGSTVTVTEPTPWAWPVAAGAATVGTLALLTKIVGRARRRHHLQYG